MGHLTICSKSHAKPKVEENQRIFANGRFCMALPQMANPGDFFFKTPVQNRDERQWFIGIPR